MPGPPPPPPPPPPMPGAVGGPPPPPPMPGGGFPARPPAAGQGRGALLGDISKGRKLKSVQTNDRSAPQVASDNKSSGGPVTGAPPIPGMRPPAPGLAPPTPPANRNRSNSDGGQGAPPIEAAPQLGGLFAGGMPKLKKTRGGVSTGADDEKASYSDPESNRHSAPRIPNPSFGAPPPPPGAAPPLPRANGFRPSLGTMESAPAIPSPLANLKKPPPRPAPKPGLSSIALGKPPPPPPSSRKISGVPPAPPLFPAASAPSLAPPPPPPPPSASSPSVAPPPPPPPASQSPAPPSAPPPPPSAPSPSLLSRPSRSTPPPTSVAPPPPPPPSAAQVAAQQAFGKSVSSLGTLDSHSSGYGPQIMPGSTANLTATSYTLTNGSGGGGNAAIQDTRWKFQDETALPPPRQFTGVPKRYRAGRGSTVPLDLGSLG